MTVGVPRETVPGEKRVSIVPAHIPSLTKAGLSVVVERGAGESSGYTDESYEARGARMTDTLEAAEVILAVRAGAAVGEHTPTTVRSGQIIIGILEPYAPHAIFSQYVADNVTSFSMELMPRITRAQSMDVLSSMANLAGYRSAILAAEALPKMFPMMMTAAGTIVAARVFVIGAGVAGLQAIATTKRLGAVVSAYDVRPAVKEQVESLGARFVEMDLQTDDAEGSGGYARAMDEEFYRKQREFMTRVIAESDVVITTAAIPGRPSPVLVTEEMVKQMQPGSVIIDLATERGGNCEISEAGESVVRYGVTIAGPLNIPSALAFNASQLYSKNITTFLLSMVDDGQVSIDMEDEIIAATLVTRDGQVPNPDTKERLGL